MTCRVYILILTGFREASEGALTWIFRERPSPLLIDLPQDFTVSLERLYEGRMTIEEFWSEYQFLTGLEEPYVNSIRRTIGLILNSLPGLKAEVPSLEFVCYLDLKEHLRLMEMSEKLLLLEASARMSSRLRLDEWRRLLAEELRRLQSAWKKASENLLESLRRGAKNAVLYRGIPRTLIERLAKEGYNVKPVYFQSYWRPPLDVLRRIIREHGVDWIPDEVLAFCVSSHLRYLDYVISSEDLETRPYTPRSWRTYTRSPPQKLRSSLTRTFIR